MFLVCFFVKTDSTVFVYKLVWNTASYWKGCNCQGL